MIFSLKRSFTAAVMTIPNAYVFLNTTGDYSVLAITWMVTGLIVNGLVGLYNTKQRAGERIDFESRVQDEQLRILRDLGEKLDRKEILSDGDMGALIAMPKKLIENTGNDALQFHYNRYYLLKESLPELEAADRKKQKLINAFNENDRQVLAVYKKQTTFTQPNASHADVNDMGGAMIIMASQGPLAPFFAKIHKPDYEKPITLKNKQGEYKETMARWGTFVHKS